MDLVRRAWWGPMAGLVAGLLLGQQPDVRDAWQRAMIGVSKASLNVDGLAVRR